MLFNDEHKRQNISQTNGLDLRQIEKSVCNNSYMGKSSILLGKKYAFVVNVQVSNFILIPTYLKSQ